MKRILLLCVLAGAAGAGLAIGLSHGPVLESSGVAQDLKPPPVPSPPAATPASAPTPATLPAGAADPFTPEERVNIAVYEKVNRSVVNITTKGVQASRFMLLEIPSEGEGSGIVLDRQGHILTNYHVIDGAGQIEVTLFDGHNYPAQLVGGDPSTDVAVLKIGAAADSLFPVVFGSSTDLRVGQRVFAIGNPFGLERTLTTGIIRA